ncbi:MAG TPA: ABC transporter permease [Thermoleophilaceae bacterium]|jgi:ABC-2 type transport system permease protein|nr:ABC transporter permease [Thermoleophilaceae bacterium]
MSTVNMPAEMRIVQGPSALGSDPRRFIALTRTLTLTDFKLKFYGSALGYLWQLVRPLMLFGILLFVFTNFIKFGKVPHYEVLLLLGIVLYSFVAEGVSSAVDSVVAREPLVRKVQFPRLVIPTAVVATAFLNLLLNLVAVFIFSVVRGVHPQWQWFELPVILLLMVMLTSGAAMLVSCLFVRYRDVKPITEVLLQALFYGTPIFYPVERIDATLRHLLVMFNPFAAIIQAAKHAFVPQSMTAAEAAGGTVNLLVPLAIIVGLFALGFYVFNKEAPRIAEEL